MTSEAPEGKEPEGMDEQGDEVMEEPADESMVNPGLPNSEEAGAAKDKARGWFSFFRSAGPSAAESPESCKPQEIKPDAPALPKREASSPLADMYGPTKLPRFTQQTPAPNSAPTSSVVTMKGLATSIATSALPSGAREASSRHSMHSVVEEIDVEGPDTLLQFALEISYGEPQRPIPETLEGHRLGFKRPYYESALGAVETESLWKEMGMSQEEFDQMLEAAFDEGQMGVQA